jgi:general secretion pathway protein D
LDRAFAYITPFLAKYFSDKSPVASGTSTDELNLRKRPSLSRRLYQLEKIQVERTWRTILVAAPALLACLAQAQSLPVRPVPITSQTSGATSAILRSVHLSGTAADVLEKAFALYGIQLIVVPPLKSAVQPLHLDLEQVDLPAMAGVLGPMTKSFFVPVSGHILLAVADDEENRLRFERLRTATIAVPNLPGTSSQEEAALQGLLAGVFDIKNPVLRGNCVTLRTTPAIYLQATDTLLTLYRPVPQVLLQIKAYTISRSYNRDAGIELPGKFIIFNVLTEAESLLNSNASVVEELIAAGLVTAGDTLGIAELLIADGYASGSVLGSGSLYFGGGYTATGVQFDSATANASLATSAVQQLQAVTLQLADGQTGKLRLGERYPVLTATTSALTTSATTVTPSIEYEELGLGLEATPHVVSADEVSLHIHEVIRALHGTSINGIPVIDNQEFSSDLTVPTGVTTVVVSNLSRTETLATQGIIDHIPTDLSREQDDSDLLITITPVMTRAAVAQTSSD